MVSRWWSDGEEVQQGWVAMHDIASELVIGMKNPLLRSQFDWMAVHRVPVEAVDNVIVRALRFNSTQ